MVRGKLHFIEWDLMAQEGWYKAQVKSLLPWFKVWR